MSDTTIETSNIDNTGDRNHKNRKKTVKIILIIVIIIAVIAAIGGILFAIKMKRNADNGTAAFNARYAVVKDDPKFINVSVFPYVPNLQLMEKTAERMFKEIEPDVQLNFVDWDCYMSTEPDNIDVFMYDVMYLDTLYENGYLSDIDFSNFKDVDDIADFAIRDTMIEEGGVKKTVGVPFLLCSDFLIYREDDKEMASVENVYDLYEIIGDGEYGKNTGLLNNFLDNYPYYYLAAIHDDKDPEDRDVYKNIDKPNEQAENTIKMLARMIGKKEAHQSEFSRWINGDFAKPDLFGRGYGRVYYGYSEGLSNMQNVIDNMNVKFISLGDGPDSTEFYADLVSINTSVTDPEKRKYCEELTELLTSHDYIYEIGLNEGSPAYLLPARLSIFDELAVNYPMYTELKEQLDKSDKHISRYGTWFFDYVNYLFDYLAKYIP